MENAQKVLFCAGNHCLGTPISYPDFIVCSISPPFSKICYCWVKHSVLYVNSTYVKSTYVNSNIQRQAHLNVFLFKIKLKLSQEMKKLTSCGTLARAPVPVWYCHLQPVHHLSKLLIFQHSLRVWPTWCSFNTEITARPNLCHIQLRISTWLKTDIITRDCVGFYLQQSKIFFWLSLCLKEEIISQILNNLKDRCIS